MFEECRLSNVNTTYQIGDYAKRRKTDLLLDMTTAQTSKTTSDLTLDDNLLTTPDIMKLASSHEFERMLSQQIRNSGGGANPVTPGTDGTPTGVLFPRMVTEAQEMYARGFEDALVKLYANQKQTSPEFTLLSDEVFTDDYNKTGPDVDGAVDYTVVVGGKRHATEAIDHLFTNISENVDPPITNCTSLLTSCNNTDTYGRNNRHKADSFNSAFTFNHNELVSFDAKRSGEGYNNAIQQMAASSCSRSSTSSSIVSSTCVSPSLPCGIAPIDMVQQEKIKLERKRQRNRIAATRCRERKLERIVTLEEQVRQLKARNVELTDVASIMREKICQMKMELITHVNGGCQLMLH